MNPICSVEVLLALFWRRNNAQVSIVADMFMNSIEEITSRSKQAWGIAGHDMAGRFFLSAEVDRLADDTCNKLYGNLAGITQNDGS